MEADDRARFIEMLDEEVVQYGTRGGIDQDRVVRGREAVVEYWDEVVDSWEGIEVEVDRLVDAGDVVVVFWRETARSRHSDVEIQSDTAIVVRVEAGKVVELRGYMDPEEAMEAAGLTE